MTFEEKMAIASKIMRENDKRNEDRINKEIDECKMAYKIEDVEGNVFVFAGIESGFPSYRCTGGSTHIFDLCGFKVLEQYIKIV